MASPRPFHMLLATDGSPTAAAALATAVRFPWPAVTTASAVVASPIGGDDRPPRLLTALDRGVATLAATTASALSVRWPGARTRVVDAPPIEAIVEDASRLGADVIVVGWRGHGPVRRLLTGSVSRGVVRRASCAVLVVRRPALNVRHIVVGFDGSPHARRAVGLVAALQSPPDGHVTLFMAVDAISTSLPAMLPATTRAAIAGEVSRANRARVAAARRDLAPVADTLTAAGWRVSLVVTTGAPLQGLLAAVDRTRPDLLAVGVRGTTGLRHLLLGSVAEGALNRSPVPVLLAR